MGLSKGQTNSGSFEKGNTPWNKGTKNIMKPNKTSFKKGQKSWNKGISDNRLKKYLLNLSTEEKKKIYKKISDSKKGDKSPTWKGGGRKFLRKIYRKKAEKISGRKLKPNEMVHHIDGDWRNNKLENLSIVSKSEHARIHWRQGDILGRPKCVE